MIPRLHEMVNEGWALSDEECTALLPDILQAIYDKELAVENLRREKDLTAGIPDPSCRPLQRADGGG